MSTKIAWPELVQDLLPGFELVFLEGGYGTGEEYHTQIELLQVDKRQPIPSDRECRIFSEVVRMVLTIAGIMDKYDIYDRPPNMGVEITFLNDESNGQ